MTTTPVAATRAGSLARYGPLFRNLVRREVRQRYKGSVLGLAWTLITPAVMVGAYALVFRFLLRIQIDYYAIFLFVGLTAWTFFLGGVQLASRSLVSNASLVTKVRFPREIVPLAAMTGNAFTAGAMLVIAVPLCIAFPQESALPMLALPPLVLLLTAFTAGLGLLVAALNVYFRDVEHIIGAIGLPWIFVSPVFYTFDTVPGLTGEYEWVTGLLHWANPIAPFLIAIQDSLFFGTWPFWGDVLYSVVAAAAMLAIGWGVFRRLEREMAVEL
jgi:lipopolysaccharide transport system permease protein